MDCFVIHAQDGSARCGSLKTRHGSFNTPAFMPVGTLGTVKGVSPRDLKEIGSEIVLCNSYHLHLRPGDSLIRELGGLHRFMNWNGPILTDSGGFQIYSLQQLRKITNEGVEFRSHYDGAKEFFSPESVVAIQENLDVDIMMVLDECISADTSEELANLALIRTTEWARRSIAVRSDSSRLMFGIIQGGMFPELRRRSVDQIVSLDGLDGFAIGGLSVGETKSQMYEIANLTAGLLPNERVRYLMGVGMPQDIVMAVKYGVDMFDCVIPTRSARFGRLFIGNSFINIRNSKYRKEDIKIDSMCDCYTCANFSRAYLSHLIHSREVLGIQLASVHNLRYYQLLMRRLRDSIISGKFTNFVEDFFHCEVGTV